MRLRIDIVSGFALLAGTVLWSIAGIIPANATVGSRIGSIEISDAPSATLPPDSVWVNAVNDSALLKVVTPDTVLVSKPLADSSSHAPAESLPRLFGHGFTSHPDSLSQAHGFTSPADSLSRAVADSLLQSRDSIIRSQNRSDSLLTASQDSLEAAREAVYSMIEKANDYRERYYFDKAKDCFSQAADLTSDEDLISLLSRAVQRCDYALEHTRQVPQVRVVARALLSSDDFFLYYPLPDGSWRPVEGAPAMYWPEADSTLNVIRESASDVIYPMFIGDKMYFASRELPGFGGYDIYRRDWNEGLGEWGDPVNIGFPYNSPADDFLFMTTEDGKYDVFSSTRGLAGDEVRIYVLAHDSNPQLAAVSGPKELSRLAELQVLPRLAGPGKVTAPSVSDDPTPADSLMLRYKQLRDEEVTLRSALDTATVSRGALTERLRTLVSEKRSIEENLLSVGSDEDSSLQSWDISSAIIEGTFPFPFIRHLPGDSLRINYID